MESVTNSIWHSATSSIDAADGNFLFIHKRSKTCQHFPSCYEYCTDARILVLFVFILFHKHIRLDSGGCPVPATDATFLLFLKNIRRRQLVACYLFSSFSILIFKIYFISKKKFISTWRATRGYTERRAPTSLGLQWLIQKYFIRF